MWADSEETGAAARKGEAVLLGSGYGDPSSTDYQKVGQNRSRSAAAALDFWQQPEVCPRPDLRIATKWCVITGAPSSGKTTVIRELGRRGLVVKHDLVRSYIEDELHSGRTLQQVRGDAVQFYRNVLNINVKTERSLSPGELIVFDNAIPDNLAYQTINGVPIGADLLSASTFFRYQTVFVFDRFPLKEDGVRTENDDTADRLDELLELGYRRLGYDVTRVPRLPVAERVAFVLERLEL